MRYSICTAAHLLCVAVLFCCYVGCTSPAVRRSAVAWNLSSSRAKIAQPAIARALALASQDKDVLARRMEQCPPVCPYMLVGKWNGINKGIGPAVVGLHQDVKVFQRCGQRIEGFNILVEQVAVEELDCKGWKPKLDAKTCQAKTMGRFVVCKRANDCGESVTELDYSLGDNPMLDPSRYLVDELVQVEPDLILGRARMRIGLVDVPIAYFVLFRSGSGHVDCDS